MYWVDSGQLKLGVHRANLDGTGHEWLIDLLSLRKNSGQALGQTTEFAQSMALWLDLQNGLLYWSDYFNRDIHVADLEGSPERITASIRKILSGLPGARGITGYSGDPAIPGSGKLYWVTGFSPGKSCGLTLTGRMLMEVSMSYTSSHFNTNGSTNPAGSSRKSLLESPYCLIHPHLLHPHQSSHRLQSQLQFPRPYLYQDQALPASAIVLLVVNGRLRQLWVLSQGHR